MHTADIEEIRRFYEAHQRALYAYALTLTGCGSAAEDVLHTVFYRLLRLPALPRDLKPYVYSAVRNGAVDGMRRAARSAPEESIVAHLNGSTPPDRIALQDEVAHLLRAVNEDERECIVLKIYAGLTFDEIARTRAVSPNTAASWYRRGMEKMRLAAKENAS
ncbi:MAG: sigma-70 family RNA polymerase sigma factor [Candidatus Hydrogenedentes bacterium]|nr:sigma-70 family RNA polymerase sigma factor [Candidatus Hydrogenedentota bacterium]